MFSGVDLATSCQGPRRVVGEKASEVARSFMRQAKGMSQKAKIRDLIRGRW